MGSSFDSKGVMMRKWLWMMVILYVTPLAAQSTSATAGYCTLGGSQAALSGMKSTNTLQGIIPGCTVTVYSHGTQTKATIYADSSNTPLSNPFTANVAGSSNSGAWIFWAADLACYDVVGSGGVSPNNYPAPVTLTEVCPGGAAADFASPSPIGNVTPNTGQFTTVNKAINPLTYSGADVGAQINTAISANACAPTNPCHLVLPPTPHLLFSTTISIPAATTLDCTEAGMSTRQSGVTAVPTTLKYTGSGIAVQETGDRAVFRGCSLDVGNATTGIVLSGSNSRVEYVYTIGGIVGSKVLHMTNGDNMSLNQFTSFDAVGDIIYIDNATDGQLTNIVVYGYSPAGISNHTSRSLVLDSNIGGLYITGFSGGNSGLHGMVIQKTLPGQGPVQLFLVRMIFDCSYSDGILFDSSLGGGPVQAHFTQVWAAGAGQSCNGTASTNPTANGIHISGGTQIYLDSGWIRANSNNGVLIDHTGVGDVHITNSMIQGNNWGANAAPNGSGVYVNAYIDSVEVSGNQCGDSYEQAIGGKLMNYCVAVGSAGMQNLSVHNNFSQLNNTPFLFLPPGFTGAKAIYGNTMQGGTGPQDTWLPDNVMMGEFGVGSVYDPTMRTWLIPSHGSTNSFQNAFGMNVKYDNVNNLWRLATDGANNGGAMLSASNGGTGALYVIPTNGSPTLDQTVSVAGLSAFQLMAWTATGVITFPKSTIAVTPPSGVNTAFSVGCGSTINTSYSFVAQDSLGANLFFVTCNGDLYGKNGKFLTSGGIFQASGVAGFTGTKTAGTCVFTIVGGIITNVTGC